MMASYGLLAVLALIVLSGCGTIVVSPSSYPTSPALPTPSLTPKPGTFGDLPTIVLDEMDLEPGETIDSLNVGLDALLQPVGLLESSTLREQPGFVDARMTRIGTAGQDSYWEVGGYVSWAAVYSSEADAESAFEVLVAEHEAGSGWAMNRVGRPPYGDEGVSLDGAAYGWDTNRLHIWRDGEAAAGRRRARRHGNQRRRDRALGGDRPEHGRAGRRPVTRDDVALQTIPRPNAQLEKRMVVELVATFV